MRPLSLKRPRRQNDDDSVLPLINIVFLLLIFFMVAGQLSAADPFRVDPPRSAAEGAPEGELAEILLSADGRIALDGEPIPREALAARLAARPDPEAPVRLKADAGIAAEEAVALMEILREAGVRRLRLVTVAAEG